MEKTGLSFKYYLTMPEMRLFWLSLVLIFVIGIPGFFYIPWRWLIAGASGFAVVAGITFWNSLKTARSNLALKIERNRLDSIIANLRDGVIAYDEKFRITVFNPAAEQIFHLRPAEVLDKVFVLQSVKEPRFKLFTEVMFSSLAPVVIQRSQQGAYPQLLDLVFEEPHLELRVSTDRISDDQGRVLGFVKVVRDRTRELALMKAKNEFITVASHQLRSPLTAVRWSFEALKKEKLGDSQAELVKVGSQAASKLLETVEGLLNVAKIEEGRFGYQFEQVNLIEFLEKILSQAAPIAYEYKVTVYFDKPKEEMMAMLDTQRFGIALSTLIDNAMKYNIPNGQVAVKLERMPNQPYLLISIKDTGVGIPPEAIDKLFSKFFRAKNVTQRKTEGSGLGLYIAKNIVMRHGGKIWVESVLDRGTTFYLTLPTDPKLIPQKEMVYDEE
ncbi:MAG: hypothetical protein A3I24_03765 [Candidatus Harrisonbacteria bacterium RIFCSPLOWO2_02_FULL_41_13b]|uniref:histidine kinase n=1 Tax=Candidatus Harrisonbacteria bacterium RIFCSPLOWO2_02_FULL_41_13b TaxID=1798409 RepID=A0A1G1ZRV2_9BACT|nr:MAG: hypothetical protein A3J53_03580 [Candidatus Harrisonbacteria bacterium RIFCSPHIGHO2_02_FULL_40_20]OGY67201.1 MAG: hypothetical protein A3I24_03765 [Candidatus Harrisonbacteria bacterium RIFCSPLOWO2_02_FULL_41_13b]